MRGGGVRGADPDSEVEVKADVLGSGGAVEGRGLVICACCDVGLFFGPACQLVVVTLVWLSLCNVIAFFMHGCLETASMCLGDWGGMGIASSTGRCRSC